MLSKKFNVKGEELLAKLNLKTNKVTCNKDIQESKNFSAILRTRGTK